MKLVMALLRWSNFKTKYSLFNKFGRQDFHLAKRYYDQAADFDFEAKLPRNVAVFSLQVSWQSISLPLACSDILQLGP